jgi:hypothetical protein
LKIGKVFLTVAMLCTLLAACGGGDTASAPTASTQSPPMATATEALAAVARPTPQVQAVIRTPDATSFLNWAETAYPSLFPAPQASKTLDVWTYRFYPSTNIILAVNTSGDGVGLVGTGGSQYNSVPLGKIANFACSIYPSDCTVNIFAGNYRGTYSGQEFGTFTVTVSASGQVTGTTASTTFGVTNPVSGTLESTGQLSLTVGTSGAATFTGTVSSNGLVSGAWKYSGAAASSGNTFSGNKL